MNIRRVLALLALPVVACTRSPEPEPESAASVSSAQAPVVEETKERLDAAIAVVNQVGEKLPPEIAKRGRCVVVVPDMLEGGLVVGARHGKGFATCKTPNGWSAPAPIVVSGGSFGAQVGLESVDLVMVVMDERGKNKLLGSKLVLGVDASVAAGPVGHGRQAATDTAMKAEIVAYSAARGLFAGAELTGASIEPDTETTDALYGGSRQLSTLLGGEAQIPPQAQPFVGAVRETTRRRQE